MKAYLMTTGALFALLALAHVWRAVAEWPGLVNDAHSALEGAIGLLAAALSVWAWRLVQLSARS